MNGIIKSLPQKLCFWAVLTLVAVLAPSIGNTQDFEPLFLTEATAKERGGHIQFESEHRPLPFRHYRLKSKIPYGSLQAFVRHPDGQLSIARLQKEEKGEMNVSFKTPLGDGPMHGIHTLYVVDQQIEGNRLLVRTAKWHTIHHSCGWGHGYKYDKDRTITKPLADVPLEISCLELWDGNFHSRVQSGDRLRFRVFSYGAPVAGANIRLISGKGWIKHEVTGKDGTAEFQLVRDYYPKNWKYFDSRHRERFTVVTEYESPSQGQFSGKDYSSVRYISSIPWTYIPSRKEYTSTAFGLSIGLLIIAIGALGFYIYRERRRRPYREVMFDEKD
ncbi:MAG: hypothetical protein ABIK92_11985 [Pseudomonadota bacterium]